MPGTGRRLRPRRPDAPERATPHRALAAAGCVLMLLTSAAVPGSDDLRAQAVEPLDDGTIQLRVGGRSVGTEAFAVRREGDVIKAVGRVRVDTAGGGFTPLEVWMQTDRTYRPSLFRLRPARGSIDLVAAVRQADRIRLQVSTERGDRNREFVAPENVSILEPRVIHHYYLALQQHRDRLERGSTYTGPVLVPSRGERASLSIRRLAEPGSRADAPEAGEHAYEISVGGSAVRAWTDARGRLLRVTGVDGGWSAVRVRKEGS